MNKENKEHPPCPYVPHRRLCSASLDQRLKCAAQAATLDAGLFNRFQALIDNCYYTVKKPSHEDNRQ